MNQTAPRPDLALASRGGRRLIVQKYGGSSVATAEKIRAVAAKVVAARRLGHDLVVVVSAMGRTTDDLLRLAREVAVDPCRRELDLLLATGETAAVALLAMAIRDQGEAAVALTGGQCGILTNDVHTNSRILAIDTVRARAEIERGAVVVVAGFQGVDAAGEVTTLGRGGSDTTATALAAALGADACQVYTDVAGVFSADPRRVDGARPLAELVSAEMQELAWHGAQVMKAEAVEFAHSNGVSFEIRSTFAEGPGTRVRGGAAAVGSGVWVPRRPEVAGVAGRTDLVRLSFAGTDGDREDFFRSIAGYDLVFGRLAGSGEAVDLLLSTLEIPNPEQLRRDLESRYGDQVSIEEGLGGVSLVGFGLGSRPQALYDALRVLDEAGLTVLDSFTGRESLSFVLAAAEVEEGVRRLHRAFVEAN